MSEQNLQLNYLNTRIEFQRTVDELRKSLGFPAEYTPKNVDYSGDIEKFLIVELKQDLKDWSFNKTLAYKNIKCDDPNLICKLGETVCADVRNGYLTMTYMIGGEIKYRIKFREIALN